MNTDPGLNVKKDAINIYVICRLGGPSSKKPLTEILKMLPEAEGLSQQITYFSFIFEEKRKFFDDAFYYNYTYQPMAKSHESPMRLECSYNDIGLRLLGEPNPNSNKHGSWFKFKYGN